MLEVRQNVSENYHCVVLIDPSAKIQILDLVEKEKNANARPLRRLIREHIEDIVCDYIIQKLGSIGPKITITYTDKFQVAEEECLVVKV
jgi:ATP-dependent Clp protease ATP-binding subunit ClpA